MTSATFPAASLGRAAAAEPVGCRGALFVFAVLIGVAQVARGTFAPLSAPEATAIHLDPAYLPDYAARTVLRMFAALAASLFFTFTYATWAAKSRRAGMSWSRSSTSCSRCRCWATFRSRSRSSWRCSPAACWAPSWPRSSRSSRARPGT